MSTTFSYHWTTLFFCPVCKGHVAWEAKDVFNPAAIVYNNVIHLLYRAEDFEGIYLGTSRIRLATSTDGVTFSRQPHPMFYPDNDHALIYEWEGGCEDPRIVVDASGNFIMTYTAYDGRLARLMVASSRDLVSWAKHWVRFPQCLRRCTEGLLDKIWLDCNQAEWNQWRNDGGENWWQVLDVLGRFSCVRSNVWWLARLDAIDERRSRDS